MLDLTPYRIAVLVPCYNEALTIGALVREFHANIPHARVYVFDNNSSDDTVEIARTAGALVRQVPHQGKGNVVRRMFADVEADVYIMVDGDATYDAAVAPQLAARLLTDGLDMLVASRVSDQQQAYRFGHRFGNALLTRCVAAVFGNSFTDMLSGYRFFSRRYVKSFAAHASGFETETELTVHALELRMPVAEVPTVYKARPEGSVSKLNTWRDGLRILITIVKLIMTEKPLIFFTAGFVLFALLSLGLGLPLVQTWLDTGLVPRLPTAVLCASLALVGIILLICGVILETVTKGRIEQKRFAYLSVQAPAMPSAAMPAAPPVPAAARHAGLTAQPLDVL